MINIIKNKKFSFFSQEDIQIYFSPFFDRTYSFRLNHKDVVENEKFYFDQFYMKYEKI